MPPLRIVEPLDVVEDVRSGFLPGSVTPAVAALGLEGREEAFHRRVIPDVAGAAHAAADAQAGQQSLKVFARVLTALIRVMQQCLDRAASCHGHQQRLDSELTGHHGLHRPADHAAREQVEHDRHIKPSLERPDIREVGNPLLVRRGGSELPVEHVGRDLVQRAFALIGRLGTPARPRPEASQAH